MSRVGNAIITLPAGVELKVSADNVVTVKGPKGTLSQQLSEGISLKLEDGIATLARESESKVHKAQHGLCRALVMNMVVGCTEGYRTEQELHGVGYRAAMKGDLLELALGYSHPIVIQMPPEIKATAETVKGKPPKIILESHDKQLIGQVAAKIRSFRKPEPYKGKGVRFAGEQIRRKAGKAAAK